MKVGSRGKCSAGTDRSCPAGRREIVLHCPGTPSSSRNGTPSESASRSRQPPVHRAQSSRPPRAVGTALARRTARGPARSPTRSGSAAPSRWPATKGRVIYCARGRGRAGARPKARGRTGARPAPTGRATGPRRPVPRAAGRSGDRPLAHATSASPIPPPADSPSLLQALAPLRRLPRRRPVSPEDRDQEHEPAPRKNSIASPG
jgi:hypothetical protein